MVMEVKRKEQLANYIKGLGEYFFQAVDSAPSMMEEVGRKWGEELDQVSSSVSQGEIYVPVVGGFSTGKSTALNKVIGRNILPEKVTPETAIPAELRYSESECLMAQTQSGEWREYRVDQLPVLSSEAERYQVVRVYVNSRELKEIQPLVLVDMPGFDSGLDQHNQAILRYITSGALYLYMVNAKAGTVSRQDVRRLDEIMGLGRYVKVFLTMTDLASPEELKSTHQYVSEQMESISGDDSVGQINMEDVADLLSSLEEADASSLFDGIFLDQVKSLYFDACAHINTLISALSGSEDDLNRQVENAKNSLIKIESEREKMLSEIGEGRLSEKAEHVLRRLEASLNGSLDEIVVMARSGEDAMCRGIADLVRSTLTVEIQQAVRRITKDVAYQFSGDISLNGLSLSSEGNWIDNMISVIESEAMSALAGLGDNPSSRGNAGKEGAGKTVGGMLSTAALAIPHPVLKVVFSILPGVIGALFDAFREKSETEQYRKAISSQVIPSVLSQVRPQVVDSLNATESEIIRVVSEQVSSKVENQKRVYDEVASSAAEDLQAIKSNISQLEEILAAINENARKVIV